MCKLLCRRHRRRGEGAGQNFEAAIFVEYLGNLPGTFFSLTNIRLRGTGVTRRSVILLHILYSG